MITYSFIIIKLQKINLHVLTHYNFVFILIHYALKFYNTKSYDTIYVLC